nr:alpha-L-fucosidase-like [Procambarus clarkii]
MCRLSLLIFVFGAALGGYEPTWDSLDTRPLPPWYDSSKIGIMICWGLYSVPSYGNEWFWNAWQSTHNPNYVKFMEDNFKPNFTYQDFAAEFTAEFYNPDEWARMFAASGARYTVFVAKHHEGYTMWPSTFSWNWNSVDVGPRRDLFGDLAKAIRSTAPHIHVGVYHSLFEWYNPLYLEDKSQQYMSNNFVTRKTLPELYELVNNYHPEVIWSDGDWEAEDWYWNSTIFLAWLFNESPVKDTVVVNDRWGKGIGCHHGSFYNCEDRYNPGVLQPHKWENAMTLDKHSWGYRREAPATDYLTIHDLLTTLAQTISCGGNLLVNVGPTHDGRIPPIMEERLRQLGSWVDINGDAVYDSTPWTHQNDSVTPGVWYTQKGNLVYSIVLSWPKGDTLTLGSVLSTSQTSVTMLGYSGSRLEFMDGADGLKVTFPRMSQVTSQWVWVLAMSGVTPAQTSDTAEYEAILQLFT